MSFSGGIVGSQSVIGEPVDLAGKLTWLGTAILQGVGFLGLAEINTIFTIILTFVSILYGVLKLYEKFLDVREKRRRQNQAHNSEDAE